MNIIKEKYKDSGIELFTLRNSQGMEVLLSNVGASILKMLVPNRNGQVQDVVLGYKDPEAYFDNKASHGAVVGRVANRISNAQFSLNGRVYQLDKNEGKNTLHNGFERFANRIWRSELMDNESVVKFSLHSPDGDQGMPGSADISVRYHLNDDNALSVSYQALADRDTFFNLTNHAYFNLEGENQASVLDHVLYLDCDSFTPVDEASIPSGEIRSVSGTAFDFRQKKAIGRDIAKSDTQLQNGHGYDHNFVLNNPGFDKPVAVVEAPDSGIVMEVFTDLPGVQFYTGNFLGREAAERNKSAYVSRSGFCLETQYFPDTPNKPQFPSCMFKAGTEFESKTVFKFSLVD